MRLKSYAKIRFGQFLFVLTFSSVISRPIHLFNNSCGFQKYLSKKGLIKKNYLGKNLAVTVFYFCYGHASLGIERIFHWIAIFCHYVNYIHVCK